MKSTESSVPDRHGPAAFLSATYMIFIEAVRKIRTAKTPPIFLPQTAAPGSGDFITKKIRYTGEWRPSVQHRLRFQFACAGSSRRSSSELENPPGHRHAVLNRF
jgi:hypothetical protein